jgi:hypothetical protein
MKYRPRSLWGLLWGPLINLGITQSQSKRSLMLRKPLYYMSLIHTECYRAIPTKPSFYDCQAQGRRFETVHPLQIIHENKEECLVIRVYIVNRARQCRRIVDVLSLSDINLFASSFRRVDSCIRTLLAREPTSDRAAPWVRVHAASSAAAAGPIRQLIIEPRSVWVRS